ncbi:hypothetical protein QTP88_013937 [Uroleucon formosanum]
MELLISEIQKRNVLWNKWNKKYRDRLISDREWDEVAKNTKMDTKRFGFTLRPTTSWHPTANGFIEQMHRQLKAAIMTHAKDSWTESLPIVLFGMRFSLKENLKATSAELVYGEPLNLPGDLFVDNQENNEEGGVRVALQPPYQGLYKVLDRNDKTFTIKIRNQPVTVTVDRVKPAYLLANEFTTDGQAHALPATTSNTPNQQQPPKTDPSIKSVRTTRSGRRTRFLDIFDPS